MEIPVYDIKGLQVQVPPDQPKNKALYEKTYRGSQTPIVIDNGGFNCRVGWSGLHDPLFCFRNIVARQKTSKDQQEVLVGSEIPEADLYKLNTRSPFERNVLQHFHTLEHIFDYLFWGLGISDSSVSNPVMITETVCSPNYCRELMLELLFECYGVPSVNLGIDSLFSFKQNVRENSGMILSLGYQASHVLPVLEGEFLPNCARRINVGGYTLSSSLHRFIQTRCFYNKNLITFPLAQEIIYSHCYTALNYIDELEKLRTQNQIKIQLPWETPSVPTEDELRKRQVQRKQQGKRLKEISVKKSEEKKRIAEQELEELEELANIYRKKSTEFQEGLVARGLTNYEDLKKRINSLRSRLNLQVDESEKYNLLEVPDEELSNEELKQKRMQAIQKAAREAREQRRAKQLEEQERVQKLKQEDPQAYLKDLHLQRQEVLSRVSERNKLKQELQSRHSRTSQRRLRVMAELGSESIDDNFGMNEQDWDIYREVQKDTLEEEEEDKTLLSELDSKIAKVDPTHLVTIGEVARPLTAEDYQLLIDADRIRPAEVLFQPNIIGLEQAGVTQIMEQIFSLFSKEDSQKLANCVFVTGGPSMFPGFVDRIKSEVMTMRPFGSGFSVIRAYDPCLDAWRGSSQFAETEEFTQTCITKSEYEERGAHLTSKNQHFASNKYYTQVLGEPSKKVKTS
mgnify:CR=1 FL=1